jgi:hypothetical protein
MSGQEVTVAPFDIRKDLSEGDVVLCEVGGKQYLHIVKSVKMGGCIIGNNKGHVNGFTRWSCIYGKLVEATNDRRNL